MLTSCVIFSCQSDRSALFSRLPATSQVTNSPVVHPLSIQQVTKCCSRNPFVLKTIHLSWGVCTRVYRVCTPVCTPCVPRVYPPPCFVTSFLSSFTNNCK